MRKNYILNKALSRALSIKRPHKGLGERLMLDWVIDHLPAGVGHTVDGIGNVHVDLRSTPLHRTLFVSHVDTVHRADGPNKIRKTHGKWYASGAPLGADDGAGIAILMQLITQGKPAYYIFTVGEECGGHGASHLAEKHADLLAQFDRAVAFDRRGYSDVITHQGWGRCCSDAFAEALSDKFNTQSNDKLLYMPCDGGVYTDTAEFVDIIPECTNISCGYNYEHSDREELDIEHLVNLANTACRIDWDSLPVDRDPSVRDNKWDKWDSYATGGYGVKATSVLGSTQDSHWYFDDETYDWDRDILRDAIYDAMVGIPDDLIDLMCDAVYPEDPQMARRYVSAKKLTDEVLEEVMKQVSVYDIDTILCTLYDTLYTGA